MLFQIDVLFGIGFGGGAPPPPRNDSVNAGDVWSSFSSALATAASSLAETTQTAATSLVETSKATAAELQRSDLGGRLQQASQSGWSTMASLWSGVSPTNAGGDDRIDLARNLSRGQGAMQGFGSTDVTPSRQPPSRQPMPSNEPVQTTNDDDWDWDASPIPSPTLASSTPKAVTNQQTVPSSSAPAVPDDVADDFDDDDWGWS